MATWWVILKARAEAAIAIPRRFEAGNLYESHMEIPGSTVRGAFAAVFLRRGNLADIPQWFEHPTIRFGSLRPLPVDGAFPDGLAVLPVPRSARSCKYAAGLPKGGHGVYDLLLKAAQKPSDEEVQEEWLCPKEGCRAPIDPLDTPWLLAKWQDNFTGGFGRDYEPDLRLATHVGIGAVGTEEMNLAWEGRLFSLQCFPAGTEFRGWIAVSGKDKGEAEKRAKELLAGIGFERTGDQWQLPNLLRVGRRSSTYGALKVTAWGQGEPPWQESHGSFEQRWQLFQKRFWERVSPDTLRMEGAEKDDFVFSVTFVTDTLLLDDFLRPYRVLTGREVVRRLQKVAGCLVPEEGAVRLLASFARPQSLRGWQTAHCLPKEQDMAIAAGSVFLFLVPRSKVADEGKFKEALQRWEEQGIGWRRSEGFGQVLLCDPWHLQPTVPLFWMMEVKEKKARGLDERVANFLREHEEELRRSGLSSSQLTYLREYVHKLDRLWKQGRGEPCKQLEEHLMRQKERRISGWTQKVGEKTLAEALVDVFGLKDCDWAAVVKRADDFVMAMRVLSEAGEKGFKFSLKEWMEGDER